MNGVHDIWLFVATVFVLNATPGVDMMLAASRTLAYGVRGGISTALGISAGCVVHTLAAAFGLAALLSASAAAFAAIKWIGAAYLAWLAIGMLRSAWAGDTAHADSGAVAREAADSRVMPASPMAAAPPSKSHRSLFFQGLLTNVLNPKIAIFFLALLPQFIDANATDKTGAFLLLGALLVFQATLFLAAFVFIVAWLQKRRRGRTSPALRRGTQAAGGFVLLGLAARLALTERP